MRNSINKIIHTTHNTVITDKTKRHTARAQPLEKDRSRPLCLLKNMKVQVKYVN